MIRRIRGAGLWLLLAGVALFPLSSQAMTVSLFYQADDRPLSNPYIGNVVWASDLSRQEQPFTLVYADVTWAQLEPEKGVFDFDAFEERNQIPHWRQQGVHVILRFVMDIPGNRKHMDIPQWLYDATEGDGKHYHISYGRGYSPNYENAVLIREHDRAIRALGERYGHDPLFAYVQLGSLGHWGEWHVHDSLPGFPLTETRDKYVAPYLEAFPEAMLMMRRPFTHAAENGLGLFNDASGDSGATENWLDWIHQGGSFTLTGEEGALVPMPDAWRSAPIGGELSTAHSHSRLLGDQLEQTKSLLYRSHASWIGPNSFVGIPRDGKQQAALDELMHAIGYRLRVSRLDIADAPHDAVRFTLTWQNDGVAPFYFPWQPSLLIRGADGRRTVYPLDAALMDIQPDAAYVVNLTLSKEELPQGEFSAWVGIVNPNTGEAGVALAMGAVPEDGWYPLGNVTVR